MVKTASTMLELGRRAPDFELPNVDGKIVSLADFQDVPALVVVFMCNHCPFVKHLASELANFGRDCQAKGVAIVGISSNDVSAHPEDSPEQMVQEVEKRDYTFAYLYDDTQDVAKAYRAACTPDFYVFGEDQRLVYRGQFDDSRPDSRILVTGSDLRRAVDAVLADKPIPEPQKPSIGCNIKWRKGTEPDYFNPAGVS